MCSRQPGRMIDRYRWATGGPSHLARVRTSLVVSLAGSRWSLYRPIKCSARWSQGHQAQRLQQSSPHIAQSDSYSGLRFAPQCVQISFSAVGNSKTLLAISGFSRLPVWASIFQRDDCAAMLYFRKWSVRTFLDSPRNVCVKWFCEFVLCQTIY
jgi:hypothetical protein